MDNLEWATGYDEKFGFFYVNRSDSSLPRIPKKSVWHYATIINCNGFISPGESPLECQIHEPDVDIPGTYLLIYLCSCTLCSIHSLIHPSVHPSNFSCLQVLLLHLLLVRNCLLVSWAWKCQVLMLHWVSMSSSVSPLLQQSLLSPWRMDLSRHPRNKNILWRNTLTLRKKTSSEHNTCFTNIYYIYQVHELMFVTCI